MIRFSLLPNGIIYLPGFEPLPPKIEGPDLTDIEKILLLIGAAILMSLAIALTVYFCHKTKIQAKKDKAALIDNMRSESEVHINGKDNIRT